MADVDNSDNLHELRTRKKIVSNLYHQLNQSGDADENLIDHQEIIRDEHDPNRKSKPPKKESPFSIQNFVWLMAAAGTIYYTNFAIVIFTDPKVVRWWFNIGVLMIGVNVGICLFLILYLSYYKKVDADHWEHHYPAAIPIATAAFAFGSFCLNVGLWPLWSFLTPVVLFTIFMGVIVIICMLPNRV